jgi:hypothetical protein
MTAMMMTTTITPVRTTISCVAAGFADSPIIRHPTIGVNKTVGHACRPEMVVATADANKLSKR